MQSLLQSGVIQAKLTISQPGDPYEAEADRVADAVMHQASAGFSITKERPLVSTSGAANLQRQCACDDHPGAEEKCNQCREREMNVQRHASSAGPVPKQSSIVNSALSAGGQPLDSHSRAFFEPRFGRDFSQVRVHTSADASESARSLNALAYTVGRDIIFAAGQYEATSASGQRLLAHELTHVVQQGFGSGMSSGASDMVIHRQPPNGGTPAPGADDSAAAPNPYADPITAEPPPEHAERVAHIEGMAAEIDADTEARKSLQSQYRGLPEITDVETESQRDVLKSELTVVEKHLVQSLDARITLIDDAIQGLEAVLPGFTPSAPAAPTSSSPDDSGGGANAYTVQSELYRLQREKQKNEAQLVLIKRCLARKRIKEINAEIAALPLIATGEREQLEKEKTEQVDFLKTSAPQGSCAKPASETSHPSEASPAAIEKMKHGGGKTSGEGYIPEPYAAEEQKGVGGCTVGYGHVITAKEGTCTHNVKKDDPSQELEEKEKKKSGIKLVKCACEPSWILGSEKEAHALLVKDIAAVAKWMKQNVLVDLDQAHFDALVDLGLHHGSIPKSLLDVIHANMCKDDDAVREEYLRTSLGIKGKPKQGAKFGSRREERVWPKQSDYDPDCI